MIDMQDNYFLQAEIKWFEIAVSSDIGGRKEQQDRAGYSLAENGGVVAVCDGMGGHNGGQKASCLAMEQFLKKWKKRDIGQEPQEFLMESVLALDKEVAALRAPDGTAMKAGTTFSAVLLEQRNLHWVSVGDSRIYIYREPELVRVTKDHTYLALRQAGQLPGDLPPVKNPESVLVSFLGVGQLPKVERNREALMLQPGDIVLLATDGLYKLMSDQEIANTLKEEQQLAQVVQKLVFKALKRAKEEQLPSDNITIAAIQVN